MIIVIDNYDSFTYNLVQYLGVIDSDVLVFKNDEISVSDIKKLCPRNIIISPGPGRPESSGVSIEVVKELKDIIPILGICLGHQVIGIELGMNISICDNIYHGKTSKIVHNNDIIFEGIPSPFDATRYHSLVTVGGENIKDLSVIAKTESGTIMGIKYISAPVYGFQFHPESILTDYGHRIIKNFLRCS